MIDLHGLRPPARSGPQGRRDRTSTLALQIAAGVAALLVAAGVGSACGLAIAKAREASAARIENPWSPPNLRPAS